MIYLLSRGFSRVNEKRRKNGRVFGDRRVPRKRIIFGRGGNKGRRGQSQRRTDGADQERRADFGEQYFHVL